MSIILIAIQLFASLLHPSAAAVVVGESDDGSTVHVAAGQQLTIELDENPTTPYSWSVTRAPDGVVLRTTDDEYEQDADCPDGATGCGGTHTWHFRAAAPGTTQVALAEGRSPDDHSSTFTLQVVVDA
ncbi:MAG: protease inhibitor family protein [Thermoleophilia bacterium]|nr:protease inhibitor family protein [Thermoleophilia bacterium]